MAEIPRILPLVPILERLVAIDERIQMALDFQTKCIVWPVAAVDLYELRAGPTNLTPGYQESIHRLTELCRLRQVAILYNAVLDARKQQVRSQSGEEAWFYRDISQDKVRDLRAALRHLESESSVERFVEVVTPALEDLEYAMALWLSRPLPRSIDRYCPCRICRA